MTPRGWLIDDFALLGVTWIFGGLLLSLALGAAIGMRRNATQGLSAGLLLWGAGNLLVSAAVVAYLLVDTVTLKLAPTRCEPQSAGVGKPAHRQYHAVHRPGEPAHEVAMPAAEGVCPETHIAPVPLRVRRDALAASAPLIDADRIDDRPLAIASIWGAFGAFSLLGGALLRGHGSSGRRTPARAAAPPRPPAAWRQSIGMLLSQRGLLVFLAAFIAPFFLDGSSERAWQFGLRAAGTAFALWLLAGITAGTMTWVPGFVLVAFSAALIGFAELARRV